MSLLNYAPTKTNLQKLRGDLKFTRQGHELLDQKRNILVMELLNLVDQVIHFQQRADETLSQAFKALEQAVLHMGKLKIKNLSSSVNIKSDITIGTRKTMGVTLPVVDTSFTDHSPYFSLKGTTFRIDSALDLFKQALQNIGKLVALKISVIRLANEVKKTIRKVNALEKIAIPDLKDTVFYIQSRLEENERDMFVLMKLVKQRLEKKKVQQRRVSHE